MSVINLLHLVVQEMLRTRQKKVRTIPPLISESDIRSIYEIKLNQPVDVKLIHPTIRIDLINFLLKQKIEVYDEIYISGKDFKKWLRKIETKGFDYTIRLE